MHGLRGAYAGGSRRHRYRSHDRASGHCRPLWQNGRATSPESPLSHSPSSPRQDPHWLGPTYALLGALGFSTKAIFAKLAYAAGNADAVVLVTYRMIFAVPLLGVLLWFARREGPPPRFSRRDLVTLGWLGFTGYFLASFLDFWGLEYISASLERLILFLNPTLVVVLSALFLKQRITRRVGIALALSYAGIVIVFANDLRVTGDTAGVLTGAGLVFASMVVYAIYLTSNGRIIARIGALRFTAYGMMISAVFVFAQFLLLRPFSALDQPPFVLGQFAAMALFSTVLPVLMMNHAIRVIGSPRTAMIGTIGPVLTIGMSAYFLGESITMVQIIGAVLVAGGVVLVTVQPRGRGREEARGDAVLPP